jgi:hypothetical protein
LRRAIKALNLLRDALHYRKGCFDEGLRAIGAEVVHSIGKPTRDDVLVIWNRYGAYDDAAQQFERAGAKVIVAENGWLGKSWRGGEWFSLSLTDHGAGWPAGGPERWDGWDVELPPYRTGGVETVILGQRGIGSATRRSPMGWAERCASKTGGRIRPHPGTGDARPLEDDLANAKEVLTWASGAALKALLMGIPVWHQLPGWVGAEASRHLVEWPGEPKRDEAARLAMFRRLAWGMWTLNEIRTGVPFARLVG